MDKDFEHEKPGNWRWGVFYFNKNDSRLIVPKRIRIFGWTLNFARPASYIIMGLILAFVIYSIILSEK